MKKLIVAIVSTLVLVAAAKAAQPSLLTSLQTISAVSNDEAKLHPPVAIEATVTFYYPLENLVYVQDGGNAIFVLAPAAPLKLLRGDRVLIQGTLRESFRPIIIPDSIQVLRHGELPKATPSTFDQLIQGRVDCMLVAVHGVIRTADRRGNGTGPGIYLQLVTDGGYIDANVYSSDASVIGGLLDTEVEVTGIAAGKFDGKMQQTGILLHVPSLTDMKILGHASSSPWEAPVTSMGEVLNGYHIQDQSKRILVHGTITYYQPGSSVVLQDGTKSLQVMTLSQIPLQVGDQAYATGFADSSNTALILTQSEIVDTHLFAPIQPFRATWHELAFWSANTPNGHLYDLVSIEGQVLTEVRSAAQDEYVLSAHGQLFSAVYRHPDPNSNIPLQSMKQIPIGSKVRVTGICMNEDTNTFNSSEELPFHILLRSFGDIEVIAGPPLVNTRNLLLALGLLLIVVFAAVGRGWALDRKLRRNAAALAISIEAEAALQRRAALLEHKRSRILEDINGSRPLKGIIEDITAMVSFTLDGAPCWCEVTKGETLGVCPQVPNSLRMISAVIPAHSGPSQGTLFAGLDPETPSSQTGIEALQNGAQLARLAIETQQLYTDLRRRSEYDLLTDIPNRFALEKFIDLQIEGARQSGKILGLIYIDLDKFKPINDTYGHHVGDLYLQAVALRMSRQLLGSDMLARLGGDEFAALVSLPHGKSDLDKIVARLKQCFEELFAVGEHLLNGGASIGTALYPSDGATKDSLLSAADAAMYAAKNRKKQFK